MDLQEWRRHSSRVPAKAAEQPRSGCQAAWMEPILSIIPPLAFDGHDVGGALVPPRQQLALVAQRQLIKIPTLRKI